MAGKGRLFEERAMHDAHPALTAAAGGDVPRGRRVSSTPSSVRDHGHRQAPELRGSPQQLPQQLKWRKLQKLEGAPPTPERGDNLPWTDAWNDPSGVGGRLANGGRETTPLLIGKMESPDRRVPRAPAFIGGPHIIDRPHLASSLSDASFHCRSHALQLETRFLEYTREAAAIEASPEHYQTSVMRYAMRLLHEIVESPSPYQHILLSLFTWIKQAAFVDPTALSREGKGPIHWEGATMYMELCGKLREKVIDLEKKQAASGGKKKGGKKGGKRSPENQTGGESFTSHGGSFTSHGGSMIERVPTSSAGEVPGEMKVGEKVGEKKILKYSHSSLRGENAGGGGGNPGGGGGQSDSGEEEETMVDKLEREKEVLEKHLRESSAQIGTLQWDLEAQARTLEDTEKEATRLKGVFLRNKSELLELSAEKDMLVAERELHFHRMQNLVNRTEHDVLKAKYDALEIENKKLRDYDFAEVVVPPHYTPRPNWTGNMGAALSKAGVHVNRDTSDNSVAKLIKYIDTLHKKLKDFDHAHEEEWNQTAGKLVQKDRFIACMGTGDEVPVYLRYHGHVRNRKMQKREAEKTIREIWLDRKSQTDRNNEILKVPMDQFFLQYAKTKLTGGAPVVAEWCYNIIWTLEKNRNDADCDIFLKILRNELSEDVFFDQDSQVTVCLEVAEEVDKAMTHGQVSGSCDKTEFLEALKLTFYKNDGQITDLSKALDNVYGDRAFFKYKQLFADDRDFSQNQFAEEFRSQCVKEREVHIEEVADLVESLTEKDQLMAVEVFRQKMQKMDARKSEIDVKAYIDRGLGPKNKFSKGMDTREHSEAFMAKLLKGVCKRGPLCTETVVLPPSLLNKEAAAVKA